MITIARYLGASAIAFRSICRGASSLLRQNSIRVAATLWIIANIGVMTLGPDALPFDQPRLGSETPVDRLALVNIALAEVILLTTIVFAMTRRRKVVDIGAGIPTRAIAIRETRSMLAYAIMGLAGGWLLGTELGWHPIGFHIAGTLVGSHEHVQRTEMFTWAGYNFLVFALIPYVVFRRKYNAAALLLTSRNWRGDLMVIVTVLTIESIVQLDSLAEATTQLTAHQLLLGAPLAFALYFLGTVLPTMILIQCILIPRIFKITGSFATTALLGGVIYTTVHAFDAWQTFDSIGNASLSITFLFGTYFGPGIFKAVLTLRTGNAWVHVWAYHALAPHTLIDTPLVVDTLEISK